MENVNTREGEEEGCAITLSEVEEILHVSYATVLRLVMNAEFKAFASGTHGGRAPRLASASSMSSSRGRPLYAASRKQGSGFG
ncbi:hypothetical protein [Olsenella sp. HMSC062G07]|uniref:hypothetical protein n=1 Tax=Olsenella sp. HMSC062G07 TaxID=1739330 RepID=UPI0011D07EE6|nr:hypothetical protein [Olsenella sp. HMSC062G07]